MSRSRRGLSYWQKLWRHDRARWHHELDWVRGPGCRTPEPSVMRTWRDAPKTNEDGENTVTGPLEGVPFVVKDLYDVRGEVTGCSSAVILENNPGVFPPAQRNAFLVDEFMRRGAVLMGRSQMNEFAYGIDGRNSYTGDCRHPRDGRRITGGSSSGSAWAVAAGLVPVALGTDTGGSIRVPAALCGVYGYRRGWSSEGLDGVFPLACSMDTVGWFTGNAEDMLTLLDVCGDGNRDGRGADDDGGVPRMGWVIERAHLPAFTTAFEVDLLVAMTEFGRRFFDYPYTSQELLPEVREVVTWLLTEGRQAYNIIGSREAWNAHEGILDRFQSQYDPVVWALIDRGRNWSEERYIDAVAFRARARTRLEVLFQNIDALILPVTPASTPLNVNVDAAFRETVLSLNCPASLAGWPVLTIPIPVDDVRSGGLQVVVPPGREQVFCRILEILKEAEWPSA